MFTDVKLTIICICKNEEYKYGEKTYQRRKCEHP